MSSLLRRVPVGLLGLGRMTSLLLCSLLEFAFRVSGVGFIGFRVSYVMRRVRVSYVMCRV